MEIIGLSVVGIFNGFGGNNWINLRHSSLDIVSLIDFDE